MTRLSGILPLSLLLCAPLAAAQQVAFHEDFSGSQFPPAGWIHQQLGPNSAGWERQGGNQRAWHNYHLSPHCENYLITPAIDLSGFGQAFLHFDGETGDGQYRANHPQSIGNGIGEVRVTTDGGANWTTVWTDNTQDLFLESYSPSVDISAYAGTHGVQIGFYYYGDYAHYWHVDNILVDDTPVPVLASITNPGNGHPYFLLGQSDFATAQAMAQSLGGNLVAIESQQENNWIKNQFGNFGGTQRNLMIGYNDVALEGNFTWVSGEANLFENWATGEPNNNNGQGGDEDFVEMNPDGTWNDFDDINGGYGVVEISEARISTTPLVAGELTTITVSGMRVDAEVILVFSVNGAGPYEGRYGIMDVDPDLFTPRFPSIQGSYSFSTYLPESLAGRTLYGQGVQFFSDGTHELSAAFAEPIQ